MDVVAVQTYFSVEILSFFETLLQVRRPAEVKRGMGGESTTVSTVDANVSLNDLMKDVLFLGNRCKPWTSFIQCLLVASTGLGL